MMNEKKEIHMEDKKISVLVLGGTGAMGTELVKILGDKNFAITVTSRRAHKSDKGSITYIKGNAKDNYFLEKVLETRWDCIVDFMSYKTDEFRARVDTLLSVTDQYIFISSARVYAQSFKAITETSPRLLDVCEDKKYLATDEYALAKARQEDILQTYNKKNWTIVRPTITYNSHRLQLGCYEIQHWLFRALQGKPIVFSEDLMEKYTPMTYGGDVAYAISMLIGNPAAQGEVIQIATMETMKWKDILKLYLEELENAGEAVSVEMVHDTKTIANILGRKWQFKYNRIYNRLFDSSKMNMICGYKMQYTPMEEGLRRCMREFLAGDRRFLDISMKSEAFLDREIGCKTPLLEIDGWKKRVKYFVGRYTPYFNIVLKIKSLNNREE